MKLISVLFLMLLGAHLPQALAQEWVESTDLSKSPTEGYPEEVVARLSAAAEQERTAFGQLASVQEYIVESGKRWPAGSVVRVAFSGGSRQLHDAIAQQATRWLSESGITSLKLDFGKDALGNYRGWSTSDLEYSAEIRVSFSSRGYWSAVGRDAASPQRFPPNVASMNFENFLYGLPTNWKATVLHEFGHAFGFHHAHAAQQCADEFRWEAGPDRDKQPSIYDVFRTWQGWGPEKVRMNMSPYIAQTGDFISAADRKSVMFYKLPAIIFKDPATATCYITEENMSLSPGDLQGFALAYAPTRAQSRRLDTLAVKARDEIQVALVRSDNPATDLVLANELRAILRTQDMR